MNWQPQRIWMKAYKYRWLAVAIVLLWLAFALFGCGPKTTSPSRLIAELNGWTVTT